jgi:hypothetical protein
MISSDPGLSKPQAHHSTKKTKLYYSPIHLHFPEITHLLNSITRIFHYRILILRTTEIRVATKQICSLSLGVIYHIVRISWPRFLNFLPHRTGFPFWSIGFGSNMCPCSWPCIISIHPVVKVSRKISRHTGIICDKTTKSKPNTQSLKIMGRYGKRLTRRSLSNLRQSPPFE